jgi:hypothetical protein
MRLQPVIFSEPNFWIIAFLLILGSMALGAMLLAVHQAQRNIPEHQRTPWVLLCFGVLAFGLLLTPNVDRQFLSAADKAAIAVGLVPKAGIDLAECGKPPADMRGKAQAFTLSSSDTQPDKSGCIVTTEADTTKGTPQ